MPITTTAPNTSRIASIADCRADFLNSRMWRSMFSITTIASSTTMPVARTMPKSVRTLIEKSNSLMNAKVPISDTGIVIAGMTVLRQFCRNRNMTRMTRPIASASVHSTSMIDSRTTTTLSNATCHSSPGGKFCLRRSIVSTTPVNVSIALADGSSEMPMPCASRPRKRRFDA